MASEVVLVDGNNLLVRSMFAAKRSMSDEQGILTGGMVIFINYLSKYVKEIKPEKIVVCWDSGPSRYRRAIFPAYKAARTYSDGPERIWDMSAEFLDLVGIYQMVVAGVEADDLIGNYARRINVPEHATILSGDKDFYQLLNAHVSILHPGDDVAWTPQRFYDKFGLKPEYFSLYLAMLGDMSDNVPGVPGIGPKNAVRILNKYNMQLPLEAYEKEKLLFFQRETVERNVKLVDLVTYGPRVNLEPIPLFKPTGPSDIQWANLLNFLSAHSMNEVIRKITNNILWNGGETTKRLPARNEFRTH